jgi:hypothetical protein
MAWSRDAWPFPGACLSTHPDERARRGGRQCLFRISTAASHRLPTTSPALDAQSHLDKLVGQLLETYDRAHPSHTDLLRRLGSLHDSSGAILARVARGLALPDTVAETCAAVTLSPPTAVPHGSPITSGNSSVEEWRSSELSVCFKYPCIPLSQLRRML